MTDHFVVSVVLQTSFLGDMILTTPLIERLASRGPVHVVGTPANAAILSNHPAVASVIVFDKRKSDRGLGGVRRVAQQVRQTGATHAYLAQGSLRTAAIAWLAGIRERVGFDTSAGRLLYTRRVRYDASLHHAQRLWQLGSTATAEPVPALRPSVYPGEADRLQVAALFKAHGVMPNTPLVALAPGSVWATKRWPAYHEFASAVIPSLRSTNARLVVLGGPADKHHATLVADAVHERGGPRVIDATGSLSLLASAAVLARARVLITNDSAPLHLASAMNTPTVALFGPTVPAFGFGPLADARAIVEIADLPCRPCNAHGPQQCPLGHWKCMRDIAPQTVIEQMRVVAGDQ